ncbi:hypothetical protein FVER53590_12130 [Fusarium verticillioides]|nr:hypothetical protein FVER53590_12130 [Fusarium verticillioides]
MPSPATSLPSRNSKSDKEKSLSLNDALYNHLVLPPQLPQRQDSNLDELEKALLNRLLVSVKHMRDLPGNDQSYVWSLIERGLRATQSIHAGGHVDRTALIRELNDFGESDFLVVYVRSQNCALYIRRAQDAVFGASVVFEAFETSARNEDVLATENALQWDFPGCAVAVPLATFRENGFVSNLANFLDNASRESLTDFSAQALKAGTSMPEFRNTSEPALISSMLMAILQQNGRRLAPTLLQKMVRDDVLWNNAERPWKRLPYWLVLRVTISRYLAQRLGEIARVEYKFLLAHLFSEFLTHVQQSGEIRLDRLDFLKKKICRRLVKLEVDKDRSQDLAQRIEYLFTQLGPGLQNSISKANAFIEVSWKHQKLTMTKTIPPLPKQASFEDMKLNLKMSGITLNKIWRGYSRPFKVNTERQGTTNVAQAAKQHLSSFALEHFKLIDKELAIANLCHEQSPLPHKKVVGSAALISEYLRQAYRAYDGIPELKSSLILNIMDLWVTMDKAACAMYPLLGEFHPAFRPEMLDVLLLSTFDDMKRLQKIQVYLQDRIAACQGSTTSIFDDPVRGSFGHRFYDDSDMSGEMNDLHESIEAWATHLRDSKEKEWKTKSEEYSRLSKVIDESTCVYMVDEDNPHLPPYHDRDCRRCYLKRQLKRISIQAYEHPLPSDPHVAKAVVFELLCPQTLAKYRDATWTVMSIALPAEEGVDPKCWARDYQQLQKYANDSSMSCSLASVTKPFVSTHYHSLAFPIEWDNGRYGVCRPNGLKLAYCDKCSKQWPSRRGHLSFLHHVKLEIPDSSPFSQQDAAFFKSIYGPSSYEIMATASRCPQGINVHEYLAFQTVASGKSRRWLSILAELASANLNFSNEATMLLVTHLALQCGPLDDSRSEFRIIHEVFRDRSFCETFIEQISHRLDSLAANWREIYLMETIVTFTLRLLDFSWEARMPNISEQAISLLLRARNTCVRWFKLLRAESYKVVEAETARRFQQYGLWAALLCKRTYVPLACGRLEFDDLSLEIFIQSSITVNDSLVVKLEALPQLLQHTIIRDIRLSYRLAPIVSKRIVDDLEVFRRSLCEMWPEEEGCPRVFSQVKLYPEAPDWVFCRSRTGDSVDSIEQNVSFNCVRGLLLVDCQPMGKLPEDPKYSVVLNELFGNQALLTFPSRRPGMQYSLCVKPYRYQVHVGYGSGTQELIVRAFRGNYALQLIPRETFQGDYPDLPGPLVHNCFHWMHLRTGDIFVTSKDRPWPNEPHKGYILSLKDCTCSRTRLYRGLLTKDYIVNPSSPLFNRISRILDSLEDRSQITVYQPGGDRNLTVELPRLNIVFYTNKNRLLQSPQLQCQIDKDQDAGTWYGLRSKLVCTSLTNPMHRSILVPLGPVSARSEGCHVTVRVEPSDKFGRFNINSTLGRIDCAPEPTLVFTKALLHACTSFLLPDPLTGRTGAEEAIEWLQAGISQPWSPLTPPSMLVLHKIAGLTPRRVYYPQDLKVMRTDTWIESLPIILQNSAYRQIVDRILQESATLGMFTAKEQVIVKMAELPPSGDMHLHARAMFRQGAVTRCPGITSSCTQPANQKYMSRDRPSTVNIMHRNVLEVTNLIRKWPQSFKTTHCIAQTLSQGSTVGGFTSAFSGISINEKLKVNILQHWGSLVRFCRDSTDRYKLMYLFGPMSFHLDANMPLLRTLVASAVFSDLKDLELPKWDEFDHFQPNQAPQLDYILHLLKPYRVTAPENDAMGLGQYSSGKLLRKLQIEQAKHEAKVEDDCKYLANYLLNQWPCLEPNVSGLSRSVLIDIGPALEVIRPEWKRLFMNKDLTEHLKEVQAILDRRNLEDRYEPPTVPLSEETYTVRKTSCIIPMVAAALANKKQLVRVIVPKALLQQTAQLLQARLGGILGRGIRHVPFSRRTPTTEKNMRAYHSIHRDMLKSGGVMICQPEHQMSFMLSGRQRLLDEQPAQAGPMIKVQEWLTRVSRDILDESDYTLAVRTQLIYPSGAQTTVDGHPHRWLVVEAVLRLVDNHLYGLSRSFPHSISVIRRNGGGFPFVFFLRQDVEDELVRRLTADICHGAGGILPLTEQAMAAKDRVAVKNFLMHGRPNAANIERIRNLSPDKPSLRQSVYLLRGLLVNRILMMTLKKRWNVEYGLHPHRDPIAVPFHAKGVPSDQSEWGHPDVAILFTCLAFYYDGVNLAQLRQSLEHILKSDDPSTEYDNWTQSSENFPSSLKAWNSINVDDEIQLREIWRVVRYNEVVIDYFLNNFVFPRHAKQFEVKLQANSWDIPLSPLGSTTENDKETTSKPLSTGFSGTNDNRTMLPLNIQQQDLPSLHHTSAEVLTYLLHPRNRHCILPWDVKTQHMGRATEMDLLWCLQSKSIRILIDAGAQILEMDNYTLVQQWLKIDHFALAGLYFDEENKPWILTKEGRKTPLLASPFADDLSKCLVYLDEAHTRGTDLRLPPKARGALTLRLGQTKDHTVQAAMRLRQLGTTQIVSFFVPPEVHQSISDLRKKTIHEPIDSADVIEWLLDNTCDQIEQLQPLYYSQGMDYCRRMQAALDHPDFLTDKPQRKAYVQAIKQDEQQSLQNLYEPKLKNRAVGMQTSNNAVLKGFIHDLNARRKTFQDTGRAVHASALQEVEQEREVAFEVESVRQVKKPQHFAAFSFPGLNASLEAFIKTGRLPADTNYFTHVFHALSKTGTGRKYKVQPNVTKSKLLETAEFGRTIKPKGDLSTDDFLRPVNWIIWSSVAEIAVIITPEEAEALIPIMRNSGVPTHLLVYSAPITRKMLRFNDLTFHSIPSLPNDWKAPEWLRVELGIYAGRLYFEWGEYDAMCSLLGIQSGELGGHAQDEEPTETDTDAETETSKPRTDLEHKLTKSPLTFLQDWLAVRRRGQDFAHSPMGFVSQGKRLQEDHVFFKAAEIDNGISEETVLAPVRLSSLVENDGQDDDGYYGVDDMGANEAGDSDSSDDDKIEYDESEYASASSTD